MEIQIGNHKFHEGTGIFTKAGHLLGKRLYSERPPAGKYHDCTVLVEDTENRIFWFSTPQAAEFTKKQIKHGAS